MQRLNAIEQAVTALQGLAAAAPAAPEAPPGISRAGAGTFGADFGAAFPPGGNLEARLNSAAAAGGH